MSYIVHLYTTDSTEELDKIYNHICECGCPMYHHAFTQHPASEDLALGIQSTRMEYWVSQCVFCDCKGFKPVGNIGTRNESTL